VLKSLPMQGIEEKLTVELDLRSQAVRVKSGVADPVSPVRQSLIPGSGSFTETRRDSLEGQAGRGMARLAGLRWSGLGRPLAR
jgi:hypothetical protein